MDSLNEIFEEILHSEQDFSAKIAELRNVSSLIIQAEKGLRDSKSVSESLYGQYLLKTQKMVDNDADVRLCQTELDAILHQEQLLREEEIKLNGQCEMLKEEIETARTRFISDVTEFGRSYDLCGNGLLHREQKLTKQIDQLTKELNLLENETAHLKSQHNAVEEATRQLKTAQAAIEKEKDKQSFLKQKVDNLKQTIADCEQEKTLLDKNFNTEEFQRIQEELELCRHCPEEAECIKLRKQLQDLQRDNYKKQMKYKDRNQSSTKDVDMARHTPLHTDRNHHGNEKRGTSDNNEDFSDEVTLNEEELASLEVAELGVFDNNDEEERRMEYNHTHGGIPERNWINEDTIVQSTIRNQTSSSSRSKATPSNYYTGRPMTRWSVSREETGCHGDRISHDRHQKGVLSSHSGRDQYSEQSQHSGRGQYSGRGKSATRRRGQYSKRVKFSH